MNINWETPHFKAIYQEIQTSRFELKDIRLENLGRQCSTLFERFSIQLRCIGNSQKKQEIYRTKGDSIQLLAAQHYATTLKNLDAKWVCSLIKKLQKTGIGKIPHRLSLIVEAASKCKVLGIQETVFMEQLNPQDLQEKELVQLAGLKPTIIKEYKYDLSKLLAPLTPRRKISIPSAAIQKPLETIVEAPIANRVPPLIQPPQKEKPQEIALNIKDQLEKLPKVPTDTILRDVDKIRKEIAKLKEEPTFQLQAKQYLLLLDTVVIRAVDTSLKSIDEKLKLLGDKKHEKEGGTLYFEAAEELNKLKNVSKENKQLIAQIEEHDNQLKKAAQKCLQLTKDKTEFYEKFTKGKIQKPKFTDPSEKKKAEEFAHKIGIILSKELTVMLFDESAFKDQKRLENLCTLLKNLDPVSQIIDKSDLSKDTLKEILCRFLLKTYEKEDAVKKLQAIYSQPTDMKQLDELIEIKKSIKTLPRDLVPLVEFAYEHIANKIKHATNSLKIEQLKLTPHKEKIQEMKDIQNNLPQQPQDLDAAISRFKEILQPLQKDFGELLSQLGIDTDAITTAETKLSQTEWYSATVKEAKTVVNEYTQKIQALKKIDDLQKTLVEMKREAQKKLPKSYDIASLREFDPTQNEAENINRVLKMITFSKKIGSDEIGPIQKLMETISSKNSLKLLLSELLSIRQIEPTKGTPEEHRKQTANIVGDMMEVMRKSIINVSLYRSLIETLKTTNKNLVPVDERLEKELKSAHEAITKCFEKAIDENNKQEWASLQKKMEEAIQKNLPSREISNIANECNTFIQNNLKNFDRFFTDIKAPVITYHTKLMECVHVVKTNPLETELLQLDPNQSYTDETTAYKSYFGKRKSPTIKDCYADIYNGILKDAAGGLQLQIKDTLLVTGENEKRRGDLLEIYQKIKIISQFANEQGRGIPGAAIEEAKRQPKPITNIQQQIDTLAAKFRDGIGDTMSDLQIVCEDFSRLNAGEQRTHLSYLLAHHADPTIGLSYKFIYNALSPVYEQQYAFEHPSPTDRRKNQNKIIFGIDPEKPFASSNFNNLTRTGKDKTISLFQRELLAKNLNNKGLKDFETNVPINDMISILEIALKDGIGKNQSFLDALSRSFTKADIKDKIEALTYLVAYKEDHSIGKSYHIMYDALSQAL